MLDAVRRAGGMDVVLSVTSDKCNENREESRPFVEDDAMGGADPYASSNGAAELVMVAYRRSFFPSERIDEHGVAVVSARAGNVLSGGDGEEARLVVDVISSFLRGEAPLLRNPRALRPWQFVLVPVAACAGSGERGFRAGRAGFDQRRRSQLVRFGTSALGRRTTTNSLFGTHVCR